MRLYVLLLFFLLFGLWLSFAATGCSDSPSSATGEDGDTEADSPEEEISDGDLDTVDCEENIIEHEDIDAEYEAAYEYDEAEIIEKAESIEEVEITETVEITEVTDTEQEEDIIQSWPGPGVALSFDDDFVEQWYTQRDLFKQYGAKVTFFITRFDKLSPENMERLRQLKADGHEIACHSLTHIDPLVFLETGTPDEYIEKEILPAIAIMQEAGFNPTAFSYPWGGRSVPLDWRLTQHFEIIRDSGRIQNPESILYKGDPVRVLTGGSVDSSRATWEDIELALNRAKQADDTALLYSHRILEESEKSHITPQTLEALLRTARDYGLKFYTYSELARGPKTQPVGRETPYSYSPDITLWDLASADLIMNNIWPTASRYEPVELPWPLTWTEDPLNEKYWRFQFYSLRPTRHLLYAYLSTGDERYLNKLRDVFFSFESVVDTSSYVADKHTSAYLALVLVNTYWKLRLIDRLDPDFKVVLRHLISSRGEFLADPAHFEPNNNHGVNQAAALLALGANFPDLAQDGDWLNLAWERIGVSLDKNVAADGVQVEQSPYYHMYIMKHFLQLYEWSVKWGNGYLADEMDSACLGMIRFATYCIQPDGEIPLISSSIQDTVFRPTNSAPNEVYELIARLDSDFAYVYTQGLEGLPPAEKSVLFPVSGWSIMRSAFLPAETFDQATQVIFDVGSYRTGHSHLDALSVHVYAHGQTLLGDSGLYSYEEGPLHDWFFGTAAHNTVSVDGQDQQVGTAYAGLFVTQNDWSFQSGWHELYAGLQHRRGVWLYKDEFILVLDRLELLTATGSVHSFAQNWHFFPGLEVRNKGAQALVLNESGAVVAHMQQLWPEKMKVQSVLGGENHTNGWMSIKYEKLTPAWALSWEQYGESARFAVLIDLTPGAHGQPQVNIQDNGEEVLVQVQLEETKLEFYSNQLALKGELAEVQVITAPPGDRPYH